MSPTIVRKDGRNVLVTGSIGGSTIITQTLQVILNVVEFDMNVKSAVSAPRMHHQWLPDLVFLEPGISPDTARLLEDMGHILARTEDGEIDPEIRGRANSVAWDGIYFYGANDERDPKSAATGP